jgi:hypothetical protein
MVLRLNTTAAVTLALMLCGCSSPWSSDVDPNSVACQGYGYSPESPKFAECMKYVESQRARRTGLTPKPAPQAPNVVCRTTSSGTTDCQAQ